MDVIRSAPLFVPHETGTFIDLRARRLMLRTPYSGIRQATAEPCRFSPATLADSRAFSDRDATRGDGPA